MSTLLSETEDKRAAGAIGESDAHLRGVGDPMHVETFSVRNLGGLGVSLVRESMGSVGEDE